MLRTVSVIGAVFALSTAAAVSVLLSGEEAHGQTTVNVEVGDTYFCSSSNVGVCETNIAAGDTVTWQWVGVLPHTVTQCDASFTTCPPAGGFNSGNLASPSTFSHTFNTAGSFEYHCNFHPVMQGRVNVAAATQATPTPSASPTPSPAQTGAAGQMASPTQTVVPAAVPATGGMPGDGGPSWPFLLMIFGGALLAASAAAGIRALRRR